MRHSLSLSLTCSRAIFKSASAFTSFFCTPLSVAAQAVEQVDVDVVGSPPTEDFLPGTDLFFLLFVNDTAGCLSSVDITFSSNTSITIGRERLLRTVRAEVSTSSSTSASITSPSSSFSSSLSSSLSSSRKSGQCNFSSTHVHLHNQQRRMSSPSLARSLLLILENIPPLAFPDVLAGTTPTPRRVTSRGTGTKQVFWSCPDDDICGSELVKECSRSAFKTPPLLLCTFCEHRGHQLVNRITSVGGTNAPLSSFPSEYSFPSLDKEDELDGAGSCALSNLTTPLDLSTLAA
mmetsp:Transcript_21683/g.40468  ORF Transcript_21683/g.40468 Transcript_21683/m.40468 type:complete len:291 (-) Transcript_21683:1962-2834(-)